jgi:hypothetical protein
MDEIGATMPQEPAEAVQVWRITHRCPACLQSWSYDILDASASPVIQDDTKLGPWMLCGSCEARRRVNYRQIANGKTEWWAPFWGSEQTAQLWARIREKAGTFTSVHLIGVHAGQKLLDEKTSLIRVLTRVPMGNGWYRNLVSITSEEYISMNCKWPIPRRPNGSKTTGWR